MIVINKTQLMIQEINTSVPNTDNVITLPPPYQNFKRQTNIKQSFNIY